MAERLGIVLYWTGVIIAGLLVVLAVFFLNESGRDSWILALISAGAGVIVWLIGRACKYVLAGQ